jgi:hypothetical protein
VRRSLPHSIHEHVQWLIAPSSESLLRSGHDVFHPGGHGLSRLHELRLHRLSLLDCRAEVRAYDAHRVGDGDLVVINDCIKYFNVFAGSRTLVGGSAQQGRVVLGTERRGPRLAMDRFLHVCHER